MTRSLLTILPSLTLIVGPRGPLQVCTRLRASRLGLVPADALVRAQAAGTILLLRCIAGHFMSTVHPV